LSWSNIETGVYNLTVAGTDNTGLQSTSSPVTLSIAQALIQSNSVWKYLDNGSDQGTAWRSPAFDDSSWQTGYADFGYGAAPATVVSYGSDPTNRFITTWFRQAFDLSNPSLLGSLTAFLSCNHGVVVYLNGTEVFRNNMPDGAIDYQTLASSSLRPQIGSGHFAHRLPPALLVPGTNVIGVEVHLSNPAADTLTFDLALIGNLPPVPPTVAITKPNAYSLVYDLGDDDWNEAILIEDGPITLCADASAIDGAVTNVQFFANGERIGSVSRFPFCMAWSNFNACSYSVTARATDESGMSALSDAAFVIVTSPHQPADLVPFYSDWRLSISNTPPPAQWRTPDFDDRDWTDAFSVFGSLAIAISSFDFHGHTAYFRTHFDVPAPAAFTNLNPLLRAWYGEGAVFYLNGIEIFRTNMPPGEPTFETRSTNGLPAVSNPTNIFLLRPGENVLAIEVHQPSDSGPTEFDFALEAVRPQPLPERAPCLQLIRTPWGYSYIHWGEPSAWGLEQADQITGPWYHAGDDGDIFVDISYWQKFYRLRHR